VLDKVEKRFETNIYIHTTPPTVPSKKYGPMIQLAVTPALSSHVVGGLTCQAYNKDSV
jgi:hypothetical protein